MYDITSKNKQEIKKYLLSFQERRNRTIVIVDYGNVEKWKNSLRWKVDIQKLAILIKNLSFGNEFLRRFYYGADYGSNDHSLNLSEWSRSIFDRAKMNRFEIIKKESSIFIAKIICRVMKKNVIWMLK